MRTRTALAGAALAVTALLTGCFGGDSEPGITDERIVIGSVLALNGPASGLGKGMRAGLEAALRGREVRGRRIELRALDDSYQPPKAAESTRRLLDEPPGVFMMAGNVGTPTAQVTLPILKEAGVPAVGFFTGAGVLRPGDGGPILNYRASYRQEVATVVEAALAEGVQPGEVCAYVQNDGYGMAGIIGVREALSRAEAPEPLLDRYDEILARSGERPVRNGIGPVGVYRRNTTDIEPGYRSLKEWEAASGQRCRLVVTVGAYGNIAHFVRYAEQQEEAWVVSAVSFTGADSFRSDLARYGIENRVLMTQVVPSLDADLAIVDEARQALGPDFGFVSLEGYIVGRMILRLLEEMPGDLTRENFMAHAREARFDLGGVAIDFTRDGNQASRFVALNQLTPRGWVAVDASAGVWQQLLAER
ncbi:ABC transporter substrate-binding protein [Spiribacter halobius]|uniref:Branched-chain amino acid ABC transporter substrate-binding protein n=1 Tax=Sediminicurvatus halobius TaxID=2182432 RepID=A0A2U2MW78_9GAMM|nr:ABC transporter substrate-binding protein [Spiribacter halobius]PWG61110.1 branched-chain amino acid ABC transporter substrate-binding protein [Spiribacter halobius]UEX77080.1 ABC transporter substrate-binding protein [Spiribacter halobius]